MELQFWKEKTGPLPNWGWGGLVLGGALGYSVWKKNKAAKSSDSSDSATSTSSGTELPGDVAPTYVFQNYDQDVTTINQAPAGGGRPPITTLPAPVTNPPPVTAPKPPTTTTPNPPAAPKGKYVTVTKWTKKNTPWNSTIWGITTKLLGPKVAWQTVWNAPQNASLRSKRKDPTKIQAGDKVWVPGAK